MSFEVLGLSEELLSAVSDAGYTKPTEIQAKTIPSALMGRDVLGIAQTGTGKTASFTLPMIDILANGRSRARMPRSLILEPTRELAVQVAENFDNYGKNHKLNHALIMGGVNFGDQEKLLDKGVDVIIATPGRLLDLFERGKFLMTGIEILVIDEADRMLDMGFIPDIEKIFKLITKNHQTLFFSATMAPPIARLTEQFLSDPKKIEVARQNTTAETITQHLVKVDGRKKRAALRNLLEYSKDLQNGIIFCNRKKDVQIVADSLKRHGYSAEALHGDMQQSERTKVLESFKANEIQILVASDVAARGLDVAAVSHVFNFDVPINAEDYVHRIGRTGRAGREGTAYTLAATNKTDAKLVDAIEKLINKKFDQNEDLNALAGDSSKKRSHSKSEQTEQNSSEEDTGSSRHQRRGRSDRHSRNESSRSENNRNENTRSDNRGRGRYGRGRYGRNQRRETMPNSAHFDNPNRKVRTAPDDMPKEPFVGMGKELPTFMAEAAPIHE
ncbi:DEAD/DEAH box helicase [Temperatibacter marinus]|uniref:DEAD-box ATP-dependent RNA helicase RhpA n=1 Tax=Temperatibacter marinus TaxID=1456591 RepID=A0AA52EGK1_9PROT|nr:DEAD/DEAH box helicase [Temperatibacter marinus]WND02134.1 DEAD/DEAH box helicase [Temperatibacter marinus]